MPQDKKMFFDGFQWIHVVGLCMIIGGSFMTGYDASIDTQWVKVILPLNFINVTGLIVFFFEFIKARFKK